MTAVKLPHQIVARILFVTALLLLAPLIAMQFTDTVAWDLTDFIIAATLLVGAGLGYAVLAHKSDRGPYRAAMGIAVATSLLLVWVNLAVGMIGTAANPLNLIYFGALALAAGGAFKVRFRASGLARIVFLMALVQAAVPIGLAVTGLGNSLALSAIFVALWLVAACLFRKSATVCKQRPDG